MNVLLIEDDPVVCKIVETVLAENDIQTTICDNASEGEGIIKDQTFNIIILDLGLPDKNGMDLCRDLRENGVDTPVLILTARDEVEAKVEGLKTGADDYLTKPFDSKELMARIHAITRRYKSDGSEEAIYRCSELELDLLSRQFKVAGEKVLLTNNEFELLAYFLKNPDRIISQEELSSEVWDIHFDTRTNYINVYISYLRKKIAEHSDRKYIKTVRKKGFIFKCKE